MPLTSIIRQECKTCGKIAVEESRMRLGKTVIIRLACSHILHFESLTDGQDNSAYDSIVSSDGCKPRAYQIDAIKFAENADARCIIADEAGLGKTWEVLGLIRLHREKILPAVVVCPSTVKVQWLHEIHRICDSTGNGNLNKDYLTQVIQSGKERAIPGFQIYVVTYDLLKKDDLFEYLPDGYLQTIIIDECQRIKNHLSDRAKAVQRVAKTVKHVIAMSGTPIKNNAGEYFTVLNLVNHTKFPHYARFIDNYCDAYSNGYGIKVGGLKNPERFYEDTKDIIIRRTKQEVLPDLPALDRKFYHVDLDPKLNKAYAQALKELEELMYEEQSFGSAAATIAIMSRLRHITGISKVTECVDFVIEHLLSCERKIVIFHHHQDVATLLQKHLNDWLVSGGYEPVLMMQSELDGTQRAALVEKFKNTNARVMIASTLAAGEGINLQFCSDAILLERQWNPANEEQAEGRFHRFGQINPVSITYMLASGTIDEYFTELVEIKRSIVASTLDKKQIQWEQSSLMKELAEILVTKGRERWKI